LPVVLVCLVTLLTGAVPCWLAWRANRRTCLLHALNWAVCAWAVWCWLLLTDLWPAADPDLAGYLALSLTGCAGVAVLGARRPGVGPWNLVVVGLLVVLLLPVFESRLTGRKFLEWDSLRTLFLAGTLTVTVVNYLATRLAPAALLLATAAAGELALLAHGDAAIHHADQVHVVSRLAIAATPWLAFALLAGRPPAISAFDGLWRDFRDRFGLFWGQRVREQFNRAAAHAGWPIQLRWQGLRILPGSLLPDDVVQKEIVAVLRALLKRFGPEEES
jgi:hypothetical protein